MGNEQKDLSGQFPTVLPLGGHRGRRGAERLRGDSRRVGVSVFFFFFFFFFFFKFLNKFIWIFKIYVLFLRGFCSSVTEQVLVQCNTVCLVELVLAIDKMVLSEFQTSSIYSRYTMAFQQQVVCRWS